MDLEILYTYKVSSKSSKESIPSSSNISSNSIMDKFAVISFRDTSYILKHESGLRISGTSKY